MESKRLRRVFSVDDFAQALEFTKKVGALAEDERHHAALVDAQNQGPASQRFHHRGENGRAISTMSRS
jgi:hypothetical protein